MARAGYPSGGARIEWNDGPVEFFPDHNAATWHAEDFGRVLDSGLIVTEDGGEIGRVVECASAEWARKGVARWLTAFHG